MKRIYPFLILALTFFTTSASVNLTSFRGVWSSDNAEAVITDSICIYFSHVDSTMQAYLMIPSENFTSKTVFYPDSTVTTSVAEQPSIELSDRKLIIDNDTLRKIEEVNIVKPYEMPQCKSKFDVGRCLQEWRLGAGYGISGNMIYSEINTNRHMFVYMVNPNMIYIRAAATRNNDNGTLFFQNIRMMKNKNTGEFTMLIEPNNLKISKTDLEIDNTKFQPKSCTFDPDGGIYWSLISFEPDCIYLNGCGETYTVKRPSPIPDFEWIQYKPYSPENTLSPLP